jgi:hypothetical protein
VLDLVCVAALVSRLSANSIAAVSKCSSFASLDPCVSCFGTLLNGISVRHAANHYEDMLLHPLSVSHSKRMNMCWALLHNLGTMLKRAGSCRYLKTFRGLDWRSEEEALVSFYVVAIECGTDAMVRSQLWVISLVMVLARFRRDASFFPPES